MGNRLKELRVKAGLSQARLGELVGSGRSTIVKLEKGIMEMTHSWMERLAPHVNAAPEDIIARRGASLPIEFAVASAFSDQSPATFDLAPAQRLQAPPGLINPDQCAGAMVLDNSADRLYPPNSTVIYRRREHLGDRLRRGSKVLARHFVTTKADGKTMEILIGILDAAATGDVVLLTRSTDRRMPASILLQPPPYHTAGLRDRMNISPDLLFGPDIRYEARPTDPAEILGVVAMAITPE